MRRKLESKKVSTKDSDKLAIESKSLADFKVPEIPLKKIQDIFKNNDLLRSRSESDLLCTKSLSMKDCVKNINLTRNKNVETEYDKSDSERIIKSSRHARTSEHLNSPKASTVFDESISEQIEIDKVGSASMSSISDDIDEIPIKSVISETKKTNISEEVKTEISDAKSETDILTQSEVQFSKNETIQSDTKEYKSDFDTVSEQSREKSISSVANKLQDIERSHVSSDRSNVQSSNAQVNAESAHQILDFSKKLDSLCLSNQNLNEDISSLENELKILSEMMSRFNDKSNEGTKSELQNKEKSTSKDISEMLSQSDKKTEITTEDKSIDVQFYKKDINSDISQYLTNSPKLKSATNISDSKSIVEEVDNVMSAVIPLDEISFSKSNQEIDYKARSKEILNEIEKSIISEHIKVSENDLNRSDILTENNNLNETNTRSLSEIYSKALQGKESVSNVQSEEDNVLMPQQSTTEIHSLSKDDSPKLISDECKEFGNNNRNETSFIQDENIDLKVSSPVELDKISKHDKSFNNKEISNDERQMKQISTDKSPVDKDDWTVLDSYCIEQDVTNSPWKKSHYSKDASHLTDSSKHQILEENIINDVEDMFSFRESTNIDQRDVNVDETVLDSDIERSSKKADNIADIIGIGSYKEQDQDDTVHSIETDNFQKAIYDSVVKILDKVEKSIEDSSIKEKIENHSEVTENKNEVKITEDEEVTLISGSFSLKDALQNENKEPLSLDTKENKNTNEDVAINKIHIDLIMGLNLHAEMKQDEDIYDIENKSREIVITELEPGSEESESLSELEIDAKVELAEEEPVENDQEDKIETGVKIVQDYKSLEPILEQDSSDGEQLDNLVEVAESSLDVIEKQTEHSVTELDSLHKTDAQSVEVQDNEIQNQKDAITTVFVDDLKPVTNCEVITSNSPNNIVNKTFDILKDPEYEDISEESLEVSEIFDKSELQRSAVIQKSSSIPEKYEAIHKSEEVLKILDEITQKSSTNFEYNVHKFQDDKHVSEDSEKSQTEISDKDSILSSKVDDKVVESSHKKNDLNNDTSKEIVSLNDLEEREKREQDALSESSDCRNTPKDVSEIEIDSSRDPNDSRLDIDGLNDDLLNNSNVENQNADSKNTYHAAPIVATSEKDIEVMIDKLKGIIFYFFISLFT